MGVLSANKDSRRSAGDIVAFAGASGHIYAGALVQADATGYAAAASGVSANRFLGVAWDEMNNTSSNKKLGTVAGGALNCRVYIKGVFTVAANGTPAQTDIGKKAYIVDDQTVGLSANAWCYAGRVVDFTASTYRLLIDSAVGIVGQDAGVSSAIAHDRLFA
jgi:hypothetical protein